VIALHPATRKEAAVDSQATNDTNEIVEPPTPRMGQDGTPIYDQEFFVALARCGKNAWNTWRRRNPDINVTFKGVNFNELENGNISFAGFEVGPVRVDFQGCKFGHNADFAGVMFGGADLSDVQFGDYANLSGATFGSESDLSRATFGSCACFTGASFGDPTDLSGVRFGDSADLTHTIFRGWICLRGATFGVRARLNAAAFGDSADLSGAIFGGGANFSDATFIGQVDLSVESGNKYDFHHISFARARFGGSVNLSGRFFVNRCDFTGAQFNQPPILDNCMGTNRIDFSGATIQFSGQLPKAVKTLGQFVEKRIWFARGRGSLSKAPGWTTDSRVTLHLRWLRKIADETNNHDLERDLYIEERKAERGIVLAQYLREGWRAFFKLKFWAHCSWILIMGGYWLLSNYGRSFVRPVLALLLSVFAFYRIYVGVLETPKAEYIPDFRNAVRAYAIANAVPFVGSLTLEKEVKTTLLCGGRADLAVPSGNSVCTPVPPPSLVFQLITIGQSIFSAICIFFAGLALRNYFKLR
jgi:uncharacterized protein YjbI with pentapeptide repeats